MEIIGGDPEKLRQLQKAEELLESGEFRQEITCAEARNMWFSMARRMYVGGDHEPSVPGDMELGHHIAGCPTSECQTLNIAYFAMLKPSRPENANQLSEALDSLEKRVRATEN
jgi:hypothetical protein